MDHPKDFRSTVLQAPSRHDDRDDDRDRDRRRHRDIMNPAPGSTRHSGFNLRSPTQSEYHHPPHSSYSSPKAASSTSHALPHHSPRSHQSGLSHPNPYSSSTAAGGPLAPSSGAGHHQAPPLSPLHPPSGYYPPPESHQTREKPATSSYYDPLTDTTRERRVSDAGWNINAANGSPKVRDNSVILSFMIQLPRWHRIGVYTMRCCLVYSRVCYCFLSWLCTILTHRHLPRSSSMLSFQPWLPLLLFLVYRSIQHQQRQQ
ncbi:uncharacterized protein CLUP02_09721 [Colletotrichum lupini]|uniref:Uncharacterized protein n=1 Tax=Colletotrichum lupini TaxID=145971 RepID=A0A9Q8SVI6_9PEZI|nr:uncharacterized protein CLUP02_09721 [Colletotrichum lupini]UQC84225.1 hypothetical protein CLUP02_09721 [Colletotrichum lupini]